MRTRTALLTLALTAAFAATAAAQVSGPAGTPPTGNQYTPVYGGTAGIAIPIGRAADDHAAGYTLGGLVEYSVYGQPYALRGELIYQHFALKSGRTGVDLSDLNVISLGATIVYKLLPSPTPATPNTYLTGGIAIYHATNEGTRPGVNGGAGIEIPLTGFSATGEARLHLMLADRRPIITLPLTVGVRF
jgi:hypothetical protein